MLAGLTDRTTVGRTIAPTARRTVRIRQRPVSTTSLACPHVCFGPSIVQAVRRNQRLVVGATLLIVAVCASECRRPANNSSATTDRRATTPQPLIGSPITPVVSVKELMKYMIDPIADNIFDAVWWDSTKAGVVKHEPRTEDDWDRVRTGAVSLAEGIELL